MVTRERRVLLPESHLRPKNPFILEEWRNVWADKNRGLPWWVVPLGLRVWDIGVLVPQARLKHMRRWWVGWWGEL